MQGSVAVLVLGVDVSPALEVSVVIHRTEYLDKRVESLYIAHLRRHVQGSQACSQRVRQCTCI